MLSELGWKTLAERQHKRRLAMLSYVCSGQPSRVSLSYRATAFNILKLARILK